MSVCNIKWAPPLQWRHNECDDVSNHRRLAGLLNRLFRHRSKKTSKFRVAGLCEGNSPVADEFPLQRASNAENVSIWWRHHVFILFGRTSWTSQCTGITIRITEYIDNTLPYMDARKWRGKRAPRLPCWYAASEWSFMGIWSWNWPHRNGHCIYCVIGKPWTANILFFSSHPIYWR